ncbi:hypothetical protein Tco_0541500 [Tanacetum coccineum]
MENEHELSYETLTRVYLGSYEHYKGVGAEVEYLEPGFELQGAKMVEKYVYTVGDEECRKEEVLCCTERSYMKGSRSGSMTLFLMDSEMVKDTGNKNDDSRKEAERSQKQAESRDDIAINVESLATKYPINGSTEASNEAKVKNDIDVIETINIELEHSVDKLHAANEQLHKENEHLKQTYKRLYDSIKKTHVQNKDNSDSLISQINQKSVENAELKAQIQEKVFENAALKNELRKLKGNSMDTKFVKASILWKPPLQPSRNHSVVRQPNAFKSVRHRISNPRFASQVDVKHNLPKPVTPHYFPNFREYAPAKPHHEDKKKTQDINWNLKPREMPSARTHYTPNVCTPKPRSNNQTFRNWPAFKSSNVKLNIVQKAYHSRNPSSCSNSKHLVRSTYQKCVFNANHDDCITKFLKEVNSRAKIAIGQRFSLNKSSARHEKPNTPRSCLRWKPTGRIFKTAGLRWIPTGKMFTDSITKVDSEPPNSSNDDITNPYECDQTLNVSACTLNLSTCISFNPKKERLRVWLLKRLISQKPGV